MAHIAFDTLKFSEKLTAAGLANPLAKALAEVQNEAFSETFDMHFATKEDIYQLEIKLAENTRSLKQEMQELKAEWQEFKVEIRQELSAIKADAKIKNWMFTFTITLILAMFIKIFLG